MEKKKYDISNAMKKYDIIIQVNVFFCFNIIHKQKSCLKVSSDSMIFNISNVNQFLEEKETHYLYLTYLLNISFLENRYGNILLIFLDVCHPEK